MKSNLDKLREETKLTKEELESFENSITYHGSLDLDIGSPEEYPNDEKNYLNAMIKLLNFYKKNNKAILKDVEEKLAFVLNPPTRCPKCAENFYIMDGRGCYCKKHYWIIGGIEDRVKVLKEEIKQLLGEKK